MSKDAGTTPSRSYIRSATDWLIIVPEPKIKGQWKRKAKTILKGRGALYIADQIFDNVLYPSILVLLGKTLGLVVMVVLTVIYCLSILLYYTKSKEDWLGVDVVESVKERGNEWVKKLYSKTGWWWRLMHAFAYIPTKIFTLTLWLLRKNDLTAFFVLCIQTDAFQTTAFLRHNRKGSLTRKDWWIFSASIVVSNVWWTLRWSIIIELVKKFV